MAVVSYLVFPAQGMMDQLHEELSLLPDCDVIAAENKDLLVLVTETRSKKQDALFREKLASFPTVAGYSLVAAFDDDSLPIENGS